MALDAGTSDEGADKFPPASMFATMQTRYASQVHVNPALVTFFVFLNTRVPPFNDVRVRRALNYAVDRNRMDDLRGGPELELPSCQVLPPSLDGYRPYCPYTIRPSADGHYTGPDLATARRLVAASGTKGEKVTVAGIAGIFQPHGGDYLVSLLRRLGYRARFENFKRGDYYAAIADPRRRIHAGITGWDQDYPSAGNFLEPQLTCGSNGNYAKFCNRRIDAEIARARSLQATIRGRPRGSGARSTTTSSTRRRGCSCRTRSRSSSSPDASATTSTARSGVLCSTSSGFADHHERALHARDKEEPISGSRLADGRW